MLSQLKHPQLESKYVKHHCESDLVPSFVLHTRIVGAIRFTCNGKLTAGNTVDTMYHSLGSHNYVLCIPLCFSLSVWPLFGETVTDIKGSIKLLFSVNTTCKH